MLRKEDILVGLRLRNSEFISEKFREYTESDFGWDPATCFSEIKIRFPFIYEFTNSQLCKYVYFHEIICCKRMVT